MSLKLTQSHYDEVGRALADRMTKTFLGAAVRATRALGVDAHVVWALSKMDRFLPRIFQGGRCSVLRYGPKDIVIELNGLPYASSGYFRGVVVSETNAMLSLFCRAATTRIVRPRRAGNESVALSFNGV